MAGDAVRLRTGTWAGVFQSPNGPIPVKGYWTTTDVLDGNTWKIRLEAGFPADSATFGAKEITLRAA